MDLNHTSPPPPGDRVLQLSQAIQESAQRLSARVARLETKPPSLDLGVSQPLESDAESVEARQAIGEMTEELQAIVKGPKSILMSPAVSRAFFLVHW